MAATRAHPTSQEPQTAAARRSLDAIQQRLVLDEQPGPARERAAAGGRRAFSHSTNPQGASIVTSLTIVRLIEAPPEAVFSAFVEPAKIALWWGPDEGPVTGAEVDARIGGRFHVRFRMLDGTEHGSSGIFEVFDPPHRLAMTWSWDDEDGHDSSVKATFKPIEGGRTELTFVHARLKDDSSRDSHEQGWAGALDKLQAKAGQLR